MIKNDKLIVVIGAIILIISSIGIIMWEDLETTASASPIDDFFYVSGSLSKIPNAITVSDADPFYPLLATPLAVHYDSECNQEIIPLYIQNFSDPS